jgi:beta-glucosidase-like glycosyl hydrolase
LRWNEYDDEAALREYLDRVIELNLGGLILFGGQLEATPRLLKGLQRRVGSHLLIMADFETGTAQQIPGGTEFPGMMAIGATRSADLSYRVGKATALESIELGINVLLAPVLDISTNPLNPIVGTRSYGDDPDLVAELGVAYVEGSQETGAMATAKHFPGHGDTDIDSHIELPTVRRGPGSLREIELRPFERAISGGVSAIMVGHIALPAIAGSDTEPASLSRKIVTDLLREKLGFDGLAMTDAMVMAGALCDGCEEAPILSALLAGIDLLLYVEDESRGIEVVKTALDDGRLEPAIVERAIRRVSTARERLVPLLPEEDGGIRIVGCREHRGLAQEVADSAATLVRNRCDLFPLTPGESGVFVLLEDDETGEERVLPERLREIFPDWPLVALDSNRPGLTGEESKLISSASKVVIFIFTTVRAWRGIADLSPNGRAIVDRILERDGRSGIVSLGSPYVMRYFPRIDGCLCLYSSSRPSQEAAARVVSGNLSPAGKLPVSIPGLYPFGWSLSFERSKE